MGSTKHTYIGVFMKIPTKKITYDEKIYVNSISRKPEKHKFNPETGMKNPVETITKTRVIYLQSIDIDKKFEGLFYVVEDYQDDYQIFLVNDNSSIYVIGNIDEDDFENITIESLNVESLITSFKTEFSTYIELFEKEFGNIGINFGIINHFM